VSVGRSKDRSARRRIHAQPRTWRLICVSLATSLALVGQASAASGHHYLTPAHYPGMTTYQCRTDAITIYPGQNLNLFARTKTCPNARKLSGPGDASPFAAGSSAVGYVTRFKPSMVELKRSGKLVTPSVWDLHLHHVVWLSPTGQPTFASGEEKTTATMPQGYGLKVGGDATWGLNYMIHNLTTSSGRQVYITWEIDWVPETSPARTDINQANIRWLDVAGAPQIYPVFDAERGFDLDGDGKYVFPDDVPTDPSQPGYEERSKISNARTWTLQDDETLVFGAGHLHPGGTHVDLQVARDGPDPGTVDGDDPSEVRRLFRSRAHYYEPAGAVSWDVSMTATPRDWRIALKAGDTVSINVTYDVSKASWYESMGILPLAYSEVADPAAKDPFADDAAVKAMYDEGGILTHGRLPENIDSKARKNLHLPDPRQLRSRGGRVAKTGIAIDGFLASLGGYSAIAGFPKQLMRPPVIRPGQSVTFTSEDALFGTPDAEQAWHTITSCRAPCNRGSGIGYPLAGGPVKFDSGELGYGTGLSSEVTTGSDLYTTPPLTKPGTYTYFCRIHPFMRGAIRVKSQGPKS
jgi:plastocyanin